jgi:D-alanyl-D-alanine carboxypeptidase
MMVYGALLRPAPDIQKVNTEPPASLLAFGSATEAYVAAQGKADLATDESMQADDHMRIGSITKTFTVTALLRLLDKKRVSLDDPV